MPDLFGDELDGAADPVEDPAEEGTPRARDGPRKKVARVKQTLVYLTPGGAVPCALCGKRPQMMIRVRGEIAEFLVACFEKHGKDKKPEFGRWSGDEREAVIAWNNWRPARLPAMTKQQAANLELVQRVFGGDEPPRAAHPIVDIGLPEPLSSFAVRPRSARTMAARHAAAAPTGR